MARTHQARLIRNLLADQAVADRLRLPADEYRGLRDEARAEPDGVSRRALLGRAAALGIGLTGAAALSGGAKAHAAPVTTPKVVGSPRIAIIGAGISGLNAALTLADKGVAATVYEANPTRIGGRMYSGGSPSGPGLWNQGQVSEWGGELVDTGHHAIKNLCQRFGLGLTDVAADLPPGAEGIFHFNGHYYPKDQVDNDFKQIWQSIKSDIQAGGSAPTWNSHNAASVALDNLSIRDWINSRVPGGFGSDLGALLDCAYAVEYGADTTTQSSYAMLVMLSWQSSPGNLSIWGGSDERWHITGGNDQVPRAIAAALPTGTVQMGHTLQAVVKNADGSQTLTFALDGGGTETVVADHTILAVPLPILQSHVDLSKAGLDQMMKGVLAHMRMGACTKLNMQFTNRNSWSGTGVWPGVSNGECFADLPYQQAWDVTRGQAGSNGILVQYGGGSLARGLTPPSAFTTASTAYTRNLVDNYLGQIDSIWPGTKAAWNGKATLSAWHLNPYSYGAYSYWPVGYLTTYAGYEGTAQGNLHFAGEHTSYDFQGYMNGGAVEGARAANEVLAAIG
ncbi:flavin monoamine oxidase family protein [Kitasatospora sp. DSM 101779]|uniref:flavin monoamine oxidase family protein n=1 Tax=Kitasatospora sp. DSM 101779 TaxID=2853165 RepID=UPI0021D804F0|nr:FAD-dependent oxidoreductase [Kitasatospora sp. DSM 101779]MCU7827198.1 FAD-dependent oxidoreductase [Kitasatospora sp. DSM 101779]